MHDVSAVHRPLPCRWNERMSDEKKDKLTHKSRKPGIADVGYGYSLCVYESVSAFLRACYRLTLLAEYFW